LQKKVSTRVLGERKRRVDEAWAELQSQNTVNIANLKAGGAKSKKAKTGVGKKAQAVLAGIFGRNTASALVSGVGSKKEVVAAPLPQRKLLAPTKVTVTEKYKYAGKEIE
jgi:hypothetical protein